MKGAVIESMKKTIGKLAIIFYSVAILVVGCSSTNSDTQSTNKKNSQANLAGKPMSPISKGENGEKERKFLTHPGKYSGNKYDVTKVKAEIKKAPLDWTREQYMEYLLSLLAEDYRPTIKKFNHLSTKVNVNTPGIGTQIELPTEKKVHFSILLDASGSMKTKIGGKSKMDIAKQAVKKFTSTLPKNAQISLRVYGHKGSSNGADKATSCNSTEEIYSAEGYQASQLQSALNSVTASGWTPIAKAIESVKQDVSSEITDSYIYVVSDGEETCGGDPVVAAKNLNQSNVKTIVNIIGFDVGSTGQQSLKQVATAGGGEFIAVSNEAALNNYLDEQYDALKKEWRKWIDEGTDLAEDQGKEIHEKAKGIQKELRDQAGVEYERLQSAKNWFKDHLKEQSDKNYSSSNHPSSLIYHGIIERRSKILNYANDRRFEKFMDSSKESRNEKSRIIDEGHDKIKDINNNKN